MSPTDVASRHAATGPRLEGPLLTALFLALTLVLGLIWSSARLLEIDEYLSFYTDSQPSLASVVQVQLHYPISLDPPTYHLLSHLAMQMLGRMELALRLPALLGFLLFQICVATFVRRLAGRRAAIVALAAPLLTISFFYAVQGRPYGLLLGLNAFALVSWQTAARSSAGWRRTAGLAGIVLSLALAITSHFFGLLAILPITLAELARTLSRRQADVPVLAAIAGGGAGLVVLLPYARAIAPYRLHYYSNTVNWHVIPQAYAALFLFHHALPVPRQHIAIALLLVFLLTLGFAALVRFRTRPSEEPAYEWAALVAVGLLPVFGYLLGRFVTHTADVRYLIAALFAMAALFGLVCQRILRRTAVFYAAITLIAILALYINAGRIHDSRALSDVQRSSLQPSREITAAFQRNPTARIYTQSLGDFFINSFYEPDPDLRARFVLVYDRDQELRWLSHDTNYLTDRNMQHFTPFTIVPFSDLLAQPDPLILRYHDGWEWMGNELKSRGLRTERIGPAMRGDLVQINTKPIR